MAIDSTSESNAAVSDEPVHVDGQQGLAEIVGDNDVVLADFYADWCGPCQMLEPVVAAVAADTAATVVKVDVDVNQQLAAAYGIRGVPTLVLFADGEPVEKLVGMQAEDQLRDTIETYSA